MGRSASQFTSASAAFQVDAGTKTANALMGNFKASATVTSEGADVASTVTGGAAVSSANGVAGTVLKIIPTDGSEPASVDVQPGCRDHGIAKTAAAVNTALPALASQPVWTAPAAPAANWYSRPVPARASR